MKRMLSGSTSAVPLANADTRQVSACHCALAHADTLQVSACHCALAHAGTLQVSACHCEERSDVAIRIPAEKGKKR